MTVRVPAKLTKRIDKLAEVTDRSSSGLAARALHVYVEEQEWQIEMIRQGERDVRAGRVVSDEKTSQWLRSWGGKRQLPRPTCE